MAHLVADVAGLPFGRATFTSASVRAAHQRLAATDLPLALADLHRVLRTGAQLHLTGSADDERPDHPSTRWDPAHLATVVEAAGFAVDAVEIDDGPADHPRLAVRATARLALPDHVAGGMRLLCCGLNPSVHAAEAGVGFVSPSNRFWPALAAAGLAERARDPHHLLRRHGIGMTDLVKRPTPRAAELTGEEYRAGLDRLGELCRWLQPQAVAMVGLAGWRAAVDRRAQPGWQAATVGDVAVYVLPSTSGLNAHVTTADLAEHLRIAASGPA